MAIFVPPGAPTHPYGPSIVTALEAALGVDRKTLCGDYWLDARYDPFVLMDTAAAEHKQRAA